jgi:hypothetical protein
VATGRTASRAARWPAVALVLAIAAVAGAGGPPAPAVAQDAGRPGVEELWRDYPLDPRGEARRPAGAPPAPAPSDGPASPLPWVLLASVVALAGAGAVARRRPRTAPAPAPARLTAPPVRAPRVPRADVEVGWRPVTGSGDDALARFELRTALGPTFVSAPFPSTSGAAPAPSLPARRAHATLVNRLIDEGWRPAGRGDAWYAVRLRR